MTALKWQRAAFFLVGALFSWATFYITGCWSEIYEATFHQGFNVAWAPRWYLIARDVLDYLPMTSVAVTFMLRFSMVPRLRPVSYAASVIAFYGVLFVIIIIGFASSPF